MFALMLRVKTCCDPGVRDDKVLVRPWREPPPSPRMARGRECTSASRRELTNTFALLLLVLLAAAGLASCMLPLRVKKKQH